MRIRTRLDAFSVTTVALVAVTALGVGWFAREAAREDRNAALLEEMHWVAHESITLRDEYLLFRTSSARRRWQQQTRRLQELLETARTHIADMGQRAALEELRADFEGTREIVGRIFRRDEERGPDRELGNFVDDGERLLIAQVLVRANRLTRQLQILQRNSAAASARTRRALTLTLAALIAFMLASVVGNGLMMRIFLTRRLALLREGAAKIGAGDLGHRIGLGGDDELGDLAREMNAMAAKLRESYASRDDLEREMRDRVRAEESLRESKERLQSIVDIAEYPAGDVQQLLAYALERALELTGSRYGYLYHYSEERRQFTLNAWSDGVMPECAVMNPETVYDLEQTGIWGEAVRQRRPLLMNDFAAQNDLKKGYPEGHVHLRTFLTIPVFSGSEIVAVVGMANKEGEYDGTDVAQLQLLMASVWRIVEDRQASAAIARTVAGLRRSNEELQQFAYIASHDLQEPLRMITSFLQLLERRYGERLEQDGREFIAYAVGGAQRLQGMIEGLLQYSRVEHHRDTFVEVESGWILDRALFNLKLLVEESGAVVTHADLPTVVGDEALLVQLFQNLLANTVKFRGSAPPRVHVSCECRPEGWCFAVQDNGVGIEERHRERIFAIFQRLNPQSHPGVGIGLAVCRRIVERHGGRIWVESTPGEGSTFFFTIPFTRAKERSHDG